MPFELFDPSREFQVTWRHLPHWEQPGATYFITWRTCDSLPKGVLAEWLSERSEWLRGHDIVVKPHDGLVIPPHLLPRYRQFVAERWESRLDDSRGECVLRLPEIASVVRDSLLHFDGERYAMGDFVVMPNRVHLLVCFEREGQLLPQCRSWKKFTATRINQLMGRSGQFWQDESFDHLVRSQDEFDHYRSYIADNPVRAKVPDGEYLLYRAPEPSPVTE